MLIVRAQALQYAIYFIYLRYTADQQQVKKNKLIISISKIGLPASESGG